MSPCRRLTLRCKTQPNKSIGEPHGSRGRADATSAARRAPGRRASGVLGRGLRGDRALSAGAGAIHGWAPAPRGDSGDRRRRTPGIGERTQGTPRASASPARVGPRALVVDSRSPRRRSTLGHARRAAGGRRSLSCPCGDRRPESSTPGRRRPGLDARAEHGGTAPGHPRTTGSRLQGARHRARSSVTGRPHGRRVHGHEGGARRADQSARSRPQR
jgi:hypothetical protein